MNPSTCFDKWELDVFNSEKRAFELTQKRIAENIPLKQEREDGHSLCPSPRNIEGYWASSKDPEKDRYKGKYPFPVALPEKWDGQDELAAHLALLEDHCKALNHTGGYFGCSNSRITGENLGSGEYWHTHNGTTWLWTVDLLPHYIKKFNVLPSQSFRDWVMAITLDAAPIPVVNEPTEIVTNAVISHQPTPAPEKDSVDHTAAPPEEGWQWEKWFYYDDKGLPISAEEYMKKCPPDAAPFQGLRFKRNIGPFIKTPTE